MHIKARSTESAEGEHNRGKRYLDGNGGMRVGVGLEHDGIVGEHHHVGLDLLRHAFGPRLWHVQPHRLRVERRDGKRHREGLRHRHLGRRPRDLRLEGSGRRGRMPVRYSGGEEYGVGR